VQNANTTALTCGTHKTLQQKACSFMALFEHDPNPIPNNSATVYKIYLQQNNVSASQHHNESRPLKAEPVELNSLLALNHSIFIIKMPIRANPRRMFIRRCGKLV